MLLPPTGRLDTLLLLKWRLNILHRYVAAPPYVKSSQITLTDIMPQVMYVTQVMYDKYQCKINLVILDFWFHKQPPSGPKS